MISGTVTNDIYTIIKFHENNDVNRINKIISRTFGKFAVIDKNWNPTNPKSVPHSEEFWIVKIKMEIRAGQKEGCFVVEPIERIDLEDINPLIPGMYTEKDVENIRFLIPNEQYRNKYLIASTDLKKTINKTSVIVLLRHDDYPEKELPN